MDVGYFMALDAAEIKKSVDDKLARCAHRNTLNDQRGRSKKSSSRIARTALPYLVMALQRIDPLASQNIDYVIMVENLANIIISKLQIFLRFMSVLICRLPLNRSPTSICPGCLRNK